MHALQCAIFAAHVLEYCALKISGAQEWFSQLLFWAWYYGSNAAWVGCTTHTVFEIVIDVTV